MKARLLLGLAAAGLVADAAFRRSRLRRLRSLGPAEETAEPVDPGHRFVTAAGVRVDAATRRAASAYARREGLDVVELVPAELQAARALELGRRFDPETYRTRRLALGVGIGSALLATDEVLRRAGVGRADGLDAAEIAEVAARLKSCAPVTTDLVVAPGLAATDCPPAAQRVMWRRHLLAELPAALGGAFLGLGILGAAIARRPGWGAAVLAAAVAQPYLATWGTPLRPRDRNAFALTRPVGAPLRLLRLATAREPADPTLPERRAEFAADLAKGVERFLEPRRPDCPWCGDTALEHFLTSGDLHHHKPGVFHLERCRGCGHIFQNPQLTVEGLEFYYREYYDGAGEAEVERGFRASGPYYRDRAEMPRPYAAPKAWLDVGAGHGHFCNAARDSWPETRFDGLDLSASIEAAERRGWVDTAHRGLFPELAGKLAGAYDVVSMFHYLEHTTDPYAELDAAATVLPQGGHLLIEVPDPECWIGRVTGRFWHPWFQPQHLNLIPMGNLVKALEERGLRTVEVHRGEAHQPADFMLSAMLLLARVAPDPSKPWRDPRYQRIGTALRAAVYIGGAPLIVGGALVDQALNPYFSRTKGAANTYRVLAQKS